ncbi:transcriptional regulator with XRE-family HTH domain [Flavobacterium sp. 9]|uniref:helix-turn-helix domain-containing protein n=1 Tax=Flavobacterium sp. 9 TaxID=2035198 RepID=UPI000C19FF38|nr:helix-turn-helix transcriptional regulator [Flavobacterium sp. 9]PIF31111.1 transcriptional regulator with XRE-family HTH domain [Flavobacterium sp. 9]
MNSLGKKISETRKLKGFTQEELAELSKVNLRTIQRIENSKNEPRGKTLSLICDVLQIDKADLQELNELAQSKTTTAFVVDGFFLILLNILLVGVIGYLTLPLEANINSKVGAVLLSFFIPFFIVHFTQKMRVTERILKFGIGWVVFLANLISVQGFYLGLNTGFRTWIFSCILIFIGVLFYGNIFFKTEK